MPKKQLMIDLIPACGAHGFPKALPEEAVIQDIAKGQCIATQFFLNLPTILASHEAPIFDRIPREQHTGNYSRR